MILFKSWRTLPIAILLFAYLSVSSVQATPLDDLLQQIKQSTATEAKKNTAREIEFGKDKKAIEAQLKKAKRERQNLLSISKKLEATQEANDKKIEKEQQRLDRRLGSLKDLFGIVQQASIDTKVMLRNSITSAQFQGREAFLDELTIKMGNTTELASISEIEQLWFEIQREMTESGKVAQFKGEIIDKFGNVTERDIIRIGAFNVISNGNYLQYIPATGKIIEPLRQPKKRFLFSAGKLSDAQNNQLTNFAIDPTGGSVLALLLKEPTPSERIAQGGKAGYIILFIGLIAVLISIERIVALLTMRAKIYRQMQNLDDISLENPLGRILSVYNPQQRVDTETLELKLAEAILREGPKIDRAIPALKIIAVIAPLLGLFGTVLGMIITFQDITLHGTGDPRTMAGGISQALVTTLLGMAVAIPTLVLHSIVSSLSRNIIHILQEQSAGILSLSIERNTAIGQQVSASANPTISRESQARADS